MSNRRAIVGSWVGVAFTFRVKKCIASGRQSIGVDLNSQIASKPLPLFLTRSVWVSAPVKLFEQLGESPSQANVTGLKSIVVTAFP
jgi:hypothetical protein